MTDLMRKIIGHVRSMPEEDQLVVLALVNAVAAGILSTSFCPGRTRESDWSNGLYHTGAGVARASGKGARCRRERRCGGDGGDGLLVGGADAEHRLGSAGVCRAGLRAAAISVAE